MTDKQKQKVRAKIHKLRRTLTDEKRKFGWFDDSRGLRYLPTSLYVKISDYDAGLKYLKWFNKNFPDDIGFPEFLFESTVILFKTGNIKAAERYALKTYFSNTFIIDKYFSKEPEKADKKVSISFQLADYVKNFNYPHGEDEFLQEFSDWLSKLPYQKGF